MNIKRTKEEQTVPLTIDNLYLTLIGTSASDGSNLAYIDRTTGDIHVTGDYVDPDIPVPHDLEDETKYITVPRSRSQRSGTVMVFRFVEEKVPELYDKISSIFERRGAYRRFKDFLLRHERLEQWHEYEQQATEAALREWCADNDIVLAD